MGDSIQQGLQALVTQNAGMRVVAVLCAALVVYVMVTAWLFIVERQWDRLSVAALARVAALAVMAYVVSKVLTGIVIDPRPYLIAHTHPPIPIARDNGFPSDHVLLAALLTASLWWVERRALVPFAVGTLLVMGGRLGVGAHHTIDVLGSVLIVVVAAAVSGALPLPDAWDRPLPQPWRRSERVRYHPTHGGRRHGGRRHDGRRQGIPTRNRPEG